MEFVKEFNKNKTELLVKIEDIENFIKDALNNDKILESFSNNNPFLDMSEFLNELKNKINLNLIGLSVVANVSTGKSTFLNALIFGKKILDASIGETTKKVYKIEYADDIDSQSIKYKSSYIKFKDLDELSDNIKKINEEKSQELNKYSEENRSVNLEDIMVNIKIHNDKLKSVILFDTPGLGKLSEDIMIQLVAKAALESNAIFYLMDISQGALSNDIENIKKIIEYIQKDKFILVLNKIDAIPADERGEKEIEQFYEKEINEPLQDYINTDKIFYISAYKALKAKEKGDSTLLEDSKFNILENYLWNEYIKKLKQDSYNDWKGKIIGTHNDIKTKLELQKNQLSRRCEDLKNIITANIEEMVKIEGYFNDYKNKITDSKNKIKEIRNNTNNISEEIISNIEPVLIEKVSSAIKEKWSGFVGGTKVLFQKEMLESTIIEAIKDIIFNNIKKDYEDKIEKELKDLQETINNINEAIKDLNNNLKNTQSMNMVQIEEIDFNIGSIIDKKGKIDNAYNINNMNMASFIAMFLARLVVEIIATLNTDLFTDIIFTDIFAEISTFIFSTTIPGLGWIIGSIIVWAKFSSLPEEIIKQVKEKVIPDVLKKLKENLDNKFSVITYKFNDILSLLDDKINVDLQSIESYKKVNKDINAKKAEIEKWESLQKTLERKINELQKIQI